MDAKYYRFHVGNFACVAASDGYSTYPPERFFMNVPKEEVDAVLLQHNLPTDTIVTPYTLLFVDTGTHRVMVDIGTGKLIQTTGFLLDNLKAAGIDPGLVDTAILTHAHLDHIGGVLTDEGTLSFPNANYYITKEEWDFWMTDAALQQPVLSGQRLQMVRDNLRAIEDRLDWLENDSEVVPGIRTIAAPGHTPGHVVVEVTSDGETLLHIVDTVLHPLHLETRIGSHFTSSCRIKPPPASSISLIGQPKSARWSSRTISRRSRIWGMSSNVM